MNEKTFSILEYQKIKDSIKELTASDLGKRLVDKLMPSTDIRAVKNMLLLTSEAKNILNSSSHVPLQGLYDISDLLRKLEKGGILQPSELVKVSSFLRGCKKIKKFMGTQDIIAPTLSSYALSITVFDEIEQEIESSIEGNRVSNKASNKLAKIRKNIETIENKIQAKLQDIVSSSKYKCYLQDFYVSRRNESFVIPVKSSYKNQIEGRVVDISSTGATVFMEPNQIMKYSKELNSLRVEEELEEYQVLATISGYIGLFIKEMTMNVEVMSEYDFAFAKGRYSNHISGIEPEISDNDYIKIASGKHPLLGDKAIPLEFEIGKDYRVLVITGPNTGGKTVALKTIGVLTLMVQSGIHVPVKRGSVFNIFEKILIDIGDSQSIQQSLSTFSGHMKNIINIINKSNHSTLVLVDEIGTGTDPSEGAALAAAILDEIYRNGAIIVATTHYGEIKDYANQHNEFKNGCMEFDPVTLAPLYSLSIGKAGNSNAFWISEKLGMRPRVLENAKKYMDSKMRDSIKVDFQIDDFKVKKPKKKVINSIQKQNKILSGDKSLCIGDMVTIMSSNEKGIVYELDDEQGNITLIVKGKHLKIKRKRVTKYISKDRLYPDGYDLNTVFVPWKKRKLEKDIERGAIKDAKEFNERVND